MSKHNTPYIMNNPEKSAVLIQNQRDYSNAWLQKMGLRPRHEKGSEVIWKTEFKDGSGNIRTRDRLDSSGKLNQYSNFHITTTGKGITKKIVKEVKREFHKPAKIAKDVGRHNESRYNDVVNAYHKRLKGG